MLKNILGKFKSSLSKTKSYISDEIKNIFSNKTLDDETISKLEDLLLSSDIGLDATESIIKSVSKLKFKKDITVNEVKQKIAEEINIILSNVEKPFQYVDKELQIIILCGVNGNGKTTTIGKLAHKFKNDGKKVMIAACDTFRAAAIDQLEIWANRAGALFFKDENSNDPASVAYRAVKQSEEENVDILLIDTSGRLHTQKNLMDEIKKITNVIKKLNPNAPHNVILALDATTGQNALNQIKVFKEAININGLAITKLDGTAKAGIVISIAKAYPDVIINFIGTGEKIEDLEYFSSEKFINNLLDLL
jgi:fused signal recognition particle receptor